jgi:isopentenyl diphosphate isomerase/L-lactate dehydrogenase-like FMN-dependent dehydrogenase
MPSSTLQVWKKIHAETIRRIWASRCKKVFEDADTHFLELKAKLVAQIEYKLTIHANLLQSRPKKAKAQEHFKRVWTQKITIAFISITNKGSLKFTLNI